VELAGRTLLGWSLRAMEAAGSIDSVVIAAPPGTEERAAEIAEGFEIEATVVPGADSRSGSVAIGVTASVTELVVVHDAARPLVEPALIDAVVRRLIANEDLAGVIAVIRATDTLKEASVSRRVIRTLDRERVWAVQTPEAFRAPDLLDVYAQADEQVLREATDDAMLVERYGGDILLHEGSPRNVKITTPTDLRFAELLIGEEAI